MAILVSRRYGRGSILQTARTDTGAVATGTTAIPGDNTIPQSGEGDQYMSLAITPKRASSHLHIQAQAILTNSNANVLVAAALFQDAIADALAAAGETIPTAGHIRALTLDWWMLAGSTAAITFKLRGGASTGATTTFNGTGGVQIFGGVFNSFIQIDEVVP